MNTWLVKQEPSTYPFSRFLVEKKVVWDGVRNYQARNFLRQMKKGDRVLYYHSVDERAVVGTAKVSRPHFPEGRGLDLGGADRGASPEKSRDP